MPEHLKALIVILPMAAMVFAFARMPASTVMARPDYIHRRNLWFALTLAAFLAHNFWVYAFIASLLLAYSAAREPNKVALFLFTLMVIPDTGSQIPGFGLVNYLISLSHVRILELVILFPAFLKLLHKSDTLPFGRLATDKALALYMILVVSLALRETSITDTLRQGLYTFTGVFLPYFVISRSLKDIRAFKEAMLGFVLAAMVLALICVFEAARHWHLYRALTYALGIPIDTLSFVERGGILRAMGTVGHPIVAGYVMTVAIGFFMFIKSSVTNKLSRRLGLALLTAGLIAPLSRGPWIGAGVMIVAFLATGPHAAKRLAILAFSGLAALPIIAILPGGQNLIGLLPFIGSIDTGTIDYRAQLLESTYAVIMRNPWVGSTDFALAPEMQAMIQGQGIIDVVNTYLLISLEYGLVGLALFVGFFALIAWNIFQGYRGLRQTNIELFNLGRSLLASLTAILVIIFTVSSVGHIPVIMWSVAGMGAAYGIMLRSAVHSTTPSRDH